MSVLTMAESLGRPVEAVYVSLSRIRKALLDCILRFERAEGHGA